MEFDFFHFFVKKELGVRILQLDFFKIFNVFKFQNAGFLKLTKLYFY